MVAFGVSAVAKIGLSQAKGTGGMAGEDEPKKTGWGTLGHQWITAIAALVTALTGAGFFVGRASAPNTEPSSAPAATTTVTVTAAGAQGGSPAPHVPTETSKPPADPDVYYSGPITSGRANLDLNPPATADNGDIEILDPGELYNTGGSVLKVWADSGIPNRDDCKTLALTDGGAEVSSLHAGSIVCGVTAKGRPFRLSVKIAGDNGTVTDAVVWNK
jgi:hypothetical protein